MGRQGVTWVCLLGRKELLRRKECLSVNLLTQREQKPTFWVDEGWEQE